MDQPVNPPSKGHITWYEGYEYFLTDATTLAHAPADMPLDSDGYRIGAFVLARTYEDVREQIAYIEDDQVRAFLGSYEEPEPDPDQTAYVVGYGDTASQLERFLGFGGKIIRGSTTGDGKYVGIIRIPREYATWQRERLAMRAFRDWVAYPHRAIEEFRRMGEIHGGFKPVPLDDHYVNHLKMPYRDYEHEPLAK